MLDSATLQKTHGVLALVGPFVDTLASEGLKSARLHTQIPLQSRTAYHITLLSKVELGGVTHDKLKTLETDTRHIYFGGVGGRAASSVVFVVIIWAAGQQLRKKLGLPPKDFHITLSAHDEHDIDKGINSLFPDQFPLSPSPTFLDHLVYTLHSFKEFQRAQNFCTDLILALPGSHKGFLRMGDAAFWGGKFKLAMLSYASAFERADDHAIQEYCIQKIIECSKNTEWGTVLLDSEIAQISLELADILIQPWSLTLRSTLSDKKVTPKLMLEPRQSLYIPLTKISTSKQYFKLPRFFRWLIPYYIAIMSTPRHEDDIAALASSHIGIRHILTLTEETPLHESWFRGKSITNTYLPIPNYYPPSIEQMDLIMTLLQDEKNLPLLIHCGGGKGRAGTVAACYMAAFGFNKPSYHQIHPEMPAPDAIALLRHMRPGSIETSQQEAFISKWCSTIWKRQSVYPNRPPEPPPTPLVVEGSLSKECNLFVLVGLPGSGKSWVSKSLLTRDPTAWTLISQDDSGSRSSCETQIGKVPRGRVLLDRCNTAASDRKSWLDLASNWAVSPACIWFDYSRDLCISRAQMRAGHPTLPPGSRVRNAVNQMQQIFVQPTLNEGFKAIIIVRSFM